MQCVPFFFFSLWKMQQEAQANLCLQQTFWIKTEQGGGMVWMIFLLPLDA